MARVTIEVTTGRGDHAQSRACSFDGDDVPLILLGAMQDGKIELIRTGIADFLDLPPEMATQLTARHVKQISAAISEINAIPNA